LSLAALFPGAAKNPPSSEKTGRDFLICFSRFCSSDWRQCAVRGVVIKNLFLCILITCSSNAGSIDFFSNNLSVCLSLPLSLLFLSNNSAAATGSKVVSSSTTKQYEEQKKEKKRNSGDSSKVVSYMPLQNALSVCIKRKNPLHIH
jgi:hypothetical protein